MLVKTLLNSVEKHKGFVYEWIKLVLVGTQKQLHIKVRPAKGCKGVCSICLLPGPTYDTLDQRKFQFVPLWGIVVFFLYAMRRISCPANRPTAGPLPRNCAWSMVLPSSTLIISIGMIARPQGDAAPPSGVYQGQGSVMTFSLSASVNG